MSQSLFAGMTNYDEQSISDIRDDIIRWRKYSQDIKQYFEETISELKKTGYWNKVPFDFACFCESIPMICDTFYRDFNIILSAIDSDSISKRELSLMKNIYSCSYENERLSWKTFKNRDDGPWKKYGNPEFTKVKNLYEKSRDFFVTLKDVGNATARMEDYVKPHNNIVNNIEDKSIHIGNSNTIESSQIGNIGDSNTIENSQIRNNVTEKAHKESFFQKYTGEIIAGIIITVVGAVICTWLGLNNPL